MADTLVTLRTAVMMLVFLVFGLTLFARHVTGVAAGAAADAAATAAADSLGAAAVGGSVSGCTTSGGRFTPEAAHQAAEAEAAAVATQRINGLLSSVVADVRVVAAEDCNLVVFVNAAVGDGRGGAWNAQATACRPVGVSAVEAGGVC